MSANNYINIKINIKQGNIFFTKFENDKGENDAQYPFDTDDNDNAANNIRVELGIAKVFHKVLNLIKTERDLFQKEDFELLGEMLSKILFGKINNNADVRKYIMKDVEQTLEITNPLSRKICRIFLEFDQKSGVAMLPWEYTLYKTRSTKEAASIYISANIKNRFHLMRRVKENPTPPLPESDKLFIMVLVNVDGNRDAIPAIDSRSNELSKIKASFQKLQDKYQDSLVVEYIESIPLDKIKQEVEDIYKKWDNQYQQRPYYVVHYVGHSMLENQVGKLVIKSAETGKPDWVEDKKFASLFSKDSLNIEQPSMVCFQACDSAKIGSFNENLRGVAYEFTKLNIAAVIGMQNEIDTLYSCAFFDRFYENILMAKDVSEAVTAGRDYLGREFNIEETYDNNSFGSPVLFITTGEPITLLKAAKPLKVEEKISEKKHENIIGKVRPSYNGASGQVKENENLTVSVASPKDEDDKLQRPAVNQDVLENKVTSGQKIIDDRETLVPNLSSIKTD